MEVNNTELKAEIQLLNKKLDSLIDYTQHQQQRNEQLNDLFSDLTLIGNSAFNSAVEELDNQQINLNLDEVKFLFIRLIKNVDNINKLVSFMESSNDLLKDFIPIVNRVGMDAINLMGQYEEKGFFKIFDNLNASSASIFNILNMILQPSFVKNIENILSVVSTIKIDDNIDDKSLYKIFKQIKKPEIRKSISFMLRVVQQINK